MTKVVAMVFLITPSSIHMDLFSNSEHVLENYDQVIVDNNYIYKGNTATLFFPFWKNLKFYIKKKEDN